MKITKATFKKLIKNHSNQLYAKTHSDFDGMTDCVEQVDDSFKQLEKTNMSFENTLGYRNIWLVGSSRDYFKPYEDETFKGIKVSNCCGSFTVAYKKQEVTK